MQNFFFILKSLWATNNFAFVCEAFGQAARWAIRLYPITLGEFPTCLVLDF